MELVVLRVPEFLRRRRSWFGRFSGAHLALWWDYAREHLIDVENGGWVHELGPDNTPAAGTWAGKPDVYHAYQAALLGLLPPARSIAAAVRDR